MTLEKTENNAKEFLADLRELTEKFVTNGSKGIVYKAGKLELN